MSKARKSKVSQGQLEVVLASLAKQFGDDVIQAFGVIGRLRTGQGWALQIRPVE
jgi:hypothetical protein